MSAPFILITTHRINPGQFEAFNAVNREYEEFVRANEPDLLAYYAYLDPDRNEVSLVHIHRDADAAERHMRIAGPQIGAGLALTSTLRVDVFGAVGPVLGQAQQANAARGAGTSVKPQVLAGFQRS